MLVQSGNESYLNMAGGVMDTGDESVADMLADLGAAQIHRHVQELRDIEGSAGAGSRRYPGYPHRLWQRHRERAADRDLHPRGAASNARACASGVTRTRAGRRSDLLPGRGKSRYRGRRTSLGRRARYASLGH